MSEVPRAQRATQIRATVLFADVIGFSRLSALAGTEAAYLAVTHLLRLLDGIARKHGGSVDKYLGDKLMAVFGYPVPLERAARAAAAAALEMRQRVADYNREADLPIVFGIRVGINTGDLVGGDIRGPVVREFHVLGDAVNVAARLNAKAPDGEVWVGPHTYEEASEEFEWRTLEPLRLKGKTRPVAAYALEAARGAAPRERLGFDERAFAELIGRDAELSRLRGRVEALAAGRGGVVLVTGEEGIGKSRLLAGLGECAEFEKVAVLQGRGSPLERGRAFGAFAPLVAEWAGIVPEEAPGARVDALHAAVGRLLGAGADASDLLARLLDLREADSGAPRPSGAVARTAELLQALFRVAASERPLLVLLEDVQWLDRNSIVLLEQLFAFAAEMPILFLLTGRPGEMAEELVRALEGSLHEVGEQMSLGPLAPEAARSLVEAALGDTADEETAALVLERGAGHPGHLLLAAFLAPTLRSEREQEAERRERTGEAERRRAAVVFADITGFTAMTEEMGGEKAYPIVAACLQILDDAARSYGGTVDHYLGDCVMALFGVPDAIEDAPRAAVNAAIDMRRRVRAFNEAHDLPVSLDVHTGVATGLGIAGDISGPLIREFAVMGDHVDLADALTHAASAGEIFTDAETRRLTAEVFEYRPAEPLESEEGKTFEAWEVRTRVPKVHRARIGAERRIFSKLEGRDPELASLKQQLAALGRGQGGIVSLIADGGIGKSRLLAELEKCEEASGLTWLEGRSLSTGRNLSFHPLADMIRHWAEITDEDDAEQGRARLDEILEAVLEEAAAEVQPLLAQLLGLPLRESESERLSQMAGDALEKLIRGGLTQLLRRGSAIRPVVVVMEDLHWADLSSIELLQSLLRLAPDHPILFLNAFRPGYAETSGQVLDFAREQYPKLHAELALAPLDAEAARRLVRNLFHGGDVPHHTRQLIEQKSQGNPFYIEEVVRALMDAGAVELRDGAFYATESLGEFEIPATVEEAVMARIDRLDLERKQVLQAASVIGGSFHHEVLAELLGDEELEQALADLEAGEFLVPTDRTAGVEYAFKHPLIQEVTYGAILEARRCELHLGVAQATEARLAEGMPGYAAMLAFHYSKGRDSERAEEFLFRAGDEAARVAASSEALHFFQQASELYLELHGEGGDASKKSLLEKNVGLALYNRGQEPESARHFDRALEHLDVPVPRSSLALNLRFALDLVSVLLRLYGRRRARPRATEMEREIIEISFHRARSQTTAEPTRFVFDSIATLHRIVDVDPRTISRASDCHAGAAGVFCLSGLSFGISKRLLDEAGALVGSETDSGYLYYRVLKFTHHFLTGDWSDEHEISEDLLRRGQRDGRLWEVTTHLAMLAEKYLRRGDFARAQSTIDWIGEIAETYEYDVAHISWVGLPMWLTLEQRKLAESAEAARRYYEDNPQELLHLLALGVTAETQVLGDDRASAEATFERIERVLGAVGRAIPFHIGSYRTARFLHDVGALEAEGDAARQRRARRSGRAAVAMAAKLAYRRPQIFRVRGRLAWLSGRRREALGWWQRSLESAESMGLRPEWARTGHELAVRLAEGRGGPAQLDGVEAPLWRERAELAYQEIGLGWDLDRLHEGRPPE